MASIPLPILSSHFCNTTVTCAFATARDLRCVFSDAAFEDIIGPLNARARDDTAKALFSELLDARAARLIWSSFEEGLEVLRGTSITIAVLGVLAWGVIKIAMTRSRGVRRWVATRKGQIWPVLMVAALFAMSIAPLTTLLLFRDSLRNSSSSTLILIATYWLWNILGLLVIYAAASGWWGHAGDNHLVGLDGRFDVFGLRKGVTRFVSSGENEKRYRDDSDRDFEDNRGPWRPSRA